MQLRSLQELRAKQTCCLSKGYRRTRGLVVHVQIPVVSMRADRLSVRTVVDKPEIRQDVTRELVFHIQGPTVFARAGMLSVGKVIDGSVVYQDDSCGLVVHNSFLVDAHYIKEVQYLCWPVADISLFRILPKAKT